MEPTEASPLFLVEKPIGNPHYNEKILEQCRPLAAGVRNRVAARSPKGFSHHRHKPIGDSFLAQGKKGRGRGSRLVPYHIIFDEWDELAKEEKLYKKLRSKKITKEEYDKLIYGGDEGSEAEVGDSD